MSIGELSEKEQSPSVLSAETAFDISQFEKLDLPTFEDTNRQTLEFLNDPCVDAVCQHKRYVHGIHCCWVQGCVCQVHYMDIPRRTK